MDRRTTVKSILAVSAISFTSFSVFKWFDLHKKPDLNYLNSKKILIEELTEMIIPTTDTPGAKEAKVADFILLTVANCLDVKEQNGFISGLKSLEKYSVEKFNVDFIGCSTENREKILTHFQSMDIYDYSILNKVRRKILGSPFFVQLKWLTVYGYCTSKPGATKGLAYDYIPGNYAACFPLQPNQKSWATK
ncbi:gluconate 2-dehydrogenase subunit 3 family protein [Pedobacter nyackensis]|uniref:Gluconate 2-dehydrogenase subunit 3 n=1 Tax=Pedobacter nyackensis TaxID=475255 RepID=A0A1W2DF08_9SPHI|nr:gluconate 2-dehydrogenase subunit 3 family protein [Pedobacter nyackensis]SMC95732.1 Gluconate 2-dehydrogenase subunit 3 [Pedobacter nyackensis]